MMRSQGNDGSTGWVFNIQRFSVHDGPGIRTTVFLKGCPLRCLWCDNPESQRAEPQIVFWDERCIGCDACLAVCSQSAIIADEAGRKQVLPERCDWCGRCLEECYAEALEQIGRLMTVDEVLSVVEEDRPFYEESGGGVTLSGGEPMAQPGFSQRLLQGCQERDIHTAIETCGHAPWETWQVLLPHLDLILYDLKETDPTRHKRYTGVSNDLILDNLRRLAGTGKRIVVRRPVIPGYNDDPEGIHALARFVQELSTVREIHLLPYHRFGRSKYDRLGQEYPMGDAPSLREEAVTGLQDILASYGLRVRIGG
jgi:pyruvate formate lyase activating enzyme